MMRTPRRALAYVAAMTLSLATAAPAAAAFKPGRYRGKTADGQKITFTATTTKVINLKFRVLTVCSDGNSGHEDEGPIAVAITAGSFTFDDTVPGSTLHIDGTLAGKRASGNITLTEHFSAQNPTQLDPNGPIACKSNAVHWSARKRPQ
jgi:hypothetical protein